MTSRSIVAIMMACMATSAALGQEKNVITVKLGSDVARAVRDATGDSTLQLEAGTYQVSETIVLDKSITIQGAGLDKTFFVRAPGNPNARFFLLNDRDAVLKGVTIRGATYSKDNGKGLGVLIDKKGGQMLECRVEQCTPWVQDVNGTGVGWWMSGAVAICGENGLVSRCIINNNSNKWSGTGGGVEISAGRLENSLIYGNRVAFAGGGVRSSGGKISNCTIVDNGSFNGSGGGIYLGDNATIMKNLIVAGNRAPTDNGPWAPELASSSSDFAKNISHSYFGEAEPLGNLPVTGEVIFSDSAKGDYTPLPGSCTINRGGLLTLAGDQIDLVGKSRVQGGTIDLGCYELDENAPSYGFTATPVSLLRGGSVKLVPAVYGLGAGSKSYRWKLTNTDRPGETITSQDETLSLVMTNAGRYDVALEVNGAVRAVRSRYLTVGVATNYLAPGNLDAAFPWDTPGTGATDLQDLLDVAVDGTTIILPEGEVKIADTVYLDRGIVLQGVGMDETTVTPAGKFRMFHLDHPEALVQDLTIKGACTPQLPDLVTYYGDAVWIGGQGGTLNRCRVTECRSEDFWHRGIVAITGDKGLVSHCIVNGNSSPYHHGAVHIEAGRLENSLIHGNQCTQAGGLYYNGGQVFNCTITDNTATDKGGGLYWRGGKAPNGICLQNLVVAGNHAKNDPSEGAPEWRCSSESFNNFNAKTANCLFGTAKPVGANSRSGDPVFVAPEKADFRLELVSPAIEAGADYEGFDDSATDLDGNARKSGTAIDIGCYELKVDRPNCAFKVEPASIAAGGTVTLTAVVTPSIDKDETGYKWVLTGPESVTVYPGSKSERVSLSKPGQYSVELTVSLGASYTSYRANCIVVAAKYAYVVPSDKENVTPVPPWDTLGKASTNLLEVVEKVPAGTEILIAEGTYKLPRQVYLDKGITLTGAGMDKTVFIPSDEKMKERFFYLNHPDCAVSGLTVKGARSANNGQNEGYGLAVWVGALGGTFSRSRVTKCHPLAYWHRGIVAITGAKGVVSQCIVDDNFNYAEINDGNDPVERPGFGTVYVGNGLLESTLIYSNRVYQSAIYYGDLLGGGHVRHCTVADNISKRSGPGLCWKSQSHGGGEGLCIQNVIFAGNICDEEAWDGNQWALDDPEHLQFLQDKTTHCLFSSGSPVGMNSITGDPMFLNPVKGDYRIPKDSIAHNAGFYEPWMDTATDLAGNPRVDHKQLVDIGCYETVYNTPSLMLLIR